MQQLSEWNVSSTCSLICRLLRQNPYRRLWQPRAGRSRGDLNQAAIAKVIETSLIDRGERNEHETDLARKLKDRVSRMIKGVQLSAETLNWVIAAFEMSEEDADLLWSTYGGDVASNGIAMTLISSRRLIRPQRHRTRSLVERYWVGASGTPTIRHTTQTIQAVENGVDEYVFDHEPQATVVDVIHGGVPGDRCEYGDGLSGRIIHLEQPLNRDQRVSLEYETSFDPNGAPLNETRRIARARVENVDIAVRFSDRVPQLMWWCVWSDELGGRPVRAELVSPRNGMAQRSVPVMERTVVGFRWQW